MIYLASKSPQRVHLLKVMGIRFRVVPSSYKEEPLKGLAPVLVALQHAVGKAKGAKAAKGIVIGADTVVACGGKAWGKPRNRRDAARMLKFFSGKSQQIITGVALRDAGTGRIAVFYASSRVTFRRMSAAEIRAYLDTGEYRGKAGSFGLQGKGAHLIRKVEGSRSNIIGLPVEKLRKELRKFTLR